MVWTRNHNRAVSILARPEGRALHRAEWRRWKRSEVSILARPEGRALPHRVVHRSIAACFNPRPPRRTGATQHRPFLTPQLTVSILARPEGRALRDERRLVCLCADVSILARPEGRALPFDDLQLSDQMLFQSSPAPKDGRYQSVFGLGIDQARFNPRPPRRTGATDQRAVSEKFSDVSILARPEGRALQKEAARIKWPDCFNPRPPRRTGATVAAASGAGS